MCGSDLTLQTLSTRITSGALPCVLELVQSLAALKVHIDDLEKNGRQRVLSAGTPTFKAKAVLPPSVVKVRFSILTCSSP